MDKVLLYFALKYHGSWDEIYDALDRKEKIDAQELEVVESQINCKYITIINPVYPNKLKNSYKPPFVLFYQGDINLLINYFKIVGLVEEKTLSDYSYHQTKKILRELNKEKKTILTMGNEQTMRWEFDRQILITNQLEHVVVQPNQLVLSESFQRSDENDLERLVFGISSWLFVSELRLDNPLFETLKIMVGSAGQIFVLPQQNNESKLANNWLIKQGAMLVESPFDILNEF